jgi:hypothetical protein
LRVPTIDGLIFQTSNRRAVASIYPPVELALDNFCVRGRDMGVMSKSANISPLTRTGCVDAVVAFANHLFVDGWSDLDHELTEVWLKIDGELISLPILKLSRFSRPDVAATIVGRKDAGRDEYGILACASIPQHIAEKSELGKAEFAFGNAGKKGQFFPLYFQTIGQLGIEHNLETRGRLERAIAAAMIRPEIVALLSAADRQFAGITPLTCHVDGLARVGQVVVADMWIANAELRKFIGLTSDGVSVIDNAAMHFGSRPDVSRHLKEIKVPTRTANHAVVAPFQSKENADRLYLGAIENGELVEITTIPIVETAAGETLIGRFLQLAGDGGFPKPDESRRVLRAMFTESKENPEWHAHTLFDGDVDPDLSIIVPFYGDDFFLQSITTMQMYFSQQVEWILVCDDPDLRPSMTSYLSRHKKFLRNRTVLVINKRNYGYSLANSIGAKVARGKLILFMNSDIWMDDPKALEVAAAAIEDGRFGAVGFRLLYEDGTVQHDGMTFEPAGYAQDLFVIEHPGKGLPPKVPSGQIVEVAAVTGALFLTSKKLYEEMNGFSNSYIRGDFEDGDLCLKLTAGGHKIGLVQHPAPYHLERQSVRLMGGAGVRSSITYLNCITFNERWAPALQGSRNS